MVNSSHGVGSGVGGTVSTIRDSAPRDNRASRQVGGGSSGGTQGATPNGPRGRRLLSASTPVESLDRAAPRGTYVDILA